MQIHGFNTNVTRKHNYITITITSYVTYASSSAITRYNMNYLINKNRLENSMIIAEVRIETRTDRKYMSNTKLSVVSLHYKH